MTIWELIKEWFEVKAGPHLLKTREDDTRDYNGWDLKLNKS